MKKRPNKRVTPRAASFKRIAKTLRIRASNYHRQATAARKHDGQHYYWLSRALSLRDFAAELDNEAATLRAMP